MPTQSGPKILVSTGKGSLFIVNINQNTEMHKLHRQKLFQDEQERVIQDMSVVQFSNSVTLIACSLGDGFLLVALLFPDLTFQVVALKKVCDIKVLNVFIANHTLSEIDNGEQLNFDVLTADGRARI